MKIRYWLICALLLTILLPVLALATAASTGTPLDANMTEAPLSTIAPTDVPEPVYHQITQDVAKSLIYNDPDVIILDVRRLDEYTEAHIPGAINIPNEDISDTMPDVLDDLNATILVYCRTGIRSKDAAEKLVALGYTGIYDIGGITTWKYATVSGKFPYGEVLLEDGAFVCKFCFNTDEPRVCASCGEKQVCKYCGNCNNCLACAC